MALTPRPIESVFDKAIGRKLKGFVVLGDRNGIMLVFDKGLSVQLTSDERIEAAEVDPSDPAS